ncbi:MAG: hypothetical protein Q9183_003037, partial [Haloplaca sp. 2 TL-2023]
NLSSVAERFAQAELRNVHMKFQESGDDGQDITFLYEVGEGVAHRSYGLNVARLANIPEPVLDVAASKSRQLEQDVKQNNITNLSRILQNSLQFSNSSQSDALIAGIEQM